jgi:hypothetical protein
MKSFSKLMDLHREIDDIFFAHQSALLHFEFGQASTLLETYRTALLRHMQDEEDILLPLYAERAEAARGGAPQIFLDDHEKMRGFVELFFEQTAKLAAEPHPESGLLLLLDREAFYKRLCAHHDNRESGMLYPALDEVTSEAEKTDLLSRVMCKLDQARSSGTSLGS